MTRDQQKQVNDLLGTVRAAELSREQQVDLIENLVCDLRRGASDGLMVLVQQSNDVTTRLREHICN